MQIIDINGKSRECLRVYHDKLWPGYITVEFESKSKPGTARKEWYPLSDFANKNPDLKKLLQNISTKEAPEFSGVVTDASADWLEDSSASWDQNAYAGYHLWISRGPGDGQTRVILNNSSNRLSLDKPWDTPPTTDSQYAVVRQIKDDIKPTGNILPITELRALEEKARQMDIDRGIKPPPRQYTIDTNLKTKLN